MLEITSVKDGLVIDHIEAGFGIKIFNYLKLDKADYRVALIMNAESSQIGRKDLIKIEKENCDDIDFTMLGMISPSITIDIVKNEEIVKKIKPELPKSVTNVLFCKNPRCITSTEKYVPHIFKLYNHKKGTYKCEYCENIRRLGDM